MARSAEETAYLVRRHIGYHLLTLHKFVGDAGDVVSLHDGEHHLTVNSQRHIHLRALHDGGPVLVAYGMTQLQRRAYHRVGIAVAYSREVYHKDRIQLEAEHNRALRFRIIGDDVAVHYLCMAGQSHGIFLAGRAGGEKTRLLRSPLIKEDIIYLTILQTVAPLFGCIDIAEYFSIYIHIQ